MTRQSVARQPKRQRLQPHQRRPLLLDAAERVFGRVGFAAARMDDVAAEAGVAKGLLYRHFVSKEELFGALMAERGAAFTARLREAWQRAKDGGEAAQEDLIAAGLEVWLDEALRPDTMLNWVEPAQWGLVRAFRDQTLAAVVDELRAAVPDLAEERAWIVAAAFQGALEGAVLQWRQGSGVGPPDLQRIVLRFANGGLAAVLDDT